MLVQAGLCRTCSETTLLVFPRGGSYDISLCLFVCAAAVAAAAGGNQSKYTVEEDPNQHVLESAQAEWDRVTTITAG